jgi:two-component system chemotaxis response regulator CheB
MPKMDGLTALRHIMEKKPVPVIIVSSLTTEGARITLDALDLGAVDFIPKNLSELSVNIVKIKEVLIEKVKRIAGGKNIRRKISPIIPRPTEISKKVEPQITVGNRRISIVAIGTSTGGPRALQEIIPKLPKDFSVPVVVAQHMPASFTGPFAERLNQLSQVTVKEAEEGEPLKQGVVFIAPGRGHMKLRKRGIETVVTIFDNEEFIYRPSVDILMMSVAECFPDRALGVILTGMGNDGLKGFVALRNAGGKILAQNEETCVVYGMPKAVVEAGIAYKVLPIEDMAGEIINSV